jgi:hypothetical protein
MSIGEGLAAAAERNKGKVAFDEEIDARITRSYP